ncbi:MAG: choice-of-anchor B family protein [Egibacteraceae bacterium]
MRPLRRPGHTHYTGRELCFNSAEDKVVIVDVTDKLTPVTVGMTDYPNVGYTHQGWLTEDHAYLIVNDELDEVTHDIDTRTVVLDVTNLQEPTVHVEHTHDTRSITHNNYVHGDRVYQSNYTSGLRVLDTTGLDDADPGLDEVAFFDTFPAHGDPTFEGSWSNYPFFESGTIAVSGIDEGLFLLRLQDSAGDPEEPLVALGCTSCPLQVRAGESGVAQVTLRNTGAAADTYALTLGQLPERWLAAVEPQEVTVGPGDTAEVAVTVGMPRRTPAGTSTLTVTATSTTDPEVAGAAPVEVHVTNGQPSNPGSTQAAGVPGPDTRTAAGPTGADAAMVAAVDDTGVPLPGVALALLLLVGGSTVSRYLVLRRR